MRDLLDRTLRLQVLLERLKEQDSREFNRVLKDIDRVVVEALSRGEVSELSRSQMEKLIAEVSEKVSSGVGSAARDLRVRMREIGLFSYEFETKSISAVSASISVAAEKTLQQIFNDSLKNPLLSTGELLQPWIDKMVAREIALVEGLLRRGFSLGWSNKEMISALRGTRKNRFTDGLLPKLGKHNKTIVNTASQHVSTSSRALLFKENDDIVSGYRWVSTLDNRTSPVDRDLDGMEFELGKGPLPPLHPNCRCQIVPTFAEKFANLLKGETRSSLTGPVPQDTTYYEWLKTQPEEFQNIAIGVTRAKLLRDGGLSAEDFGRLQLTSKFEPLTLDELRKKLPAAFRRAGI